MSKRYVLCPSAFLGSFVLLLGSISFVILATCQPTASAAGAVVVAVAAQKFDPEGEFNVLGDPPRPLSEVSTIELLRNAKRSFYNTHAGLYTTAGVTYRFKTLSVTRAKFTFTTMPIKGVSYSFTGRFLRGGVFAELDSDQWGKPILEGKLGKFKGSEKVAEANLKFSYFGGT
ncbi:MAG: hypothetical protein H0X14_01810 [Acidobacteria bacterium]|nr:hypothetical protein [Acidobacteriota bacterium]